MILVNLSYVVVGLIILRIADPFKWWAPGPEEVAKEFLQEVEFGNFEKAKKYATPETKVELDYLSSGDFYGEFNYVEIGKVDINEEEAMVDYIFGYNEKEYTLFLRRIDKEWKVNATARELVSRYETEASYDQGSYNWETEEALLIPKDPDEKPTTLRGELSDEKAVQILEEFLKSQK